MELIKGGRDEWSSSGNVPFGIALAGPLVLDQIFSTEPPIPATTTPSSSSTTPKRRCSARKAGKAPVEDSMDTDLPPQEAASEEAETVSALKSAPVKEGPGFCICKGVWMRSYMVRCDGLVSNCKISWKSGTKISRTAIPGGFIVRVLEQDGGSRVGYASGAPRPKIYRSVLFNTSLFFDSYHFATTW